MSNSLVVTPFLKIIRKPALMLINHHLFPVLLYWSSQENGNQVSPYDYTLCSRLTLVTCFPELYTTYTYIQPLFKHNESQSLQPVWSHFLFPAFCSGRFLRVASVSIDLVGFIFAIQTRGSSQGTLPSVFSLVMHEYARG